MKKRAAPDQEEILFYKNLCFNLKLMRKLHDLNMITVSKIINVSHQQYAKYEAGLNQISIYKLKILIDYYGKICDKKYSIDDYLRGKIFSL